MASGTVEYMPTTHEVIDAHLTWMRAGSFAEKTTRAARRCLIAADEDLPAGLCAATGEELAAWLAFEDWSRATRATYHKHLIRFYRWATNPGDPWLSFDPSAELRAPTVPAGLPRPAPADVVRRAIHDTADPWRLFCRLAAFAGLRACEIAVLRREDVDAEWIRVHRGKGGKGRAVPTRPLVWELVAPMPPGPLVRRPSGKPPTGDWVSTHTGAYLTSVGIPTALYGLRHAFATEVQNRYRDLRTTQELMGHASPVTTQRYTLVTDESKRDAVALLDFSAASAAGTAGPAPSAGAAPPTPRPRAASAPSVTRRDLRRRAPARSRP